MFPTVAAPQGARASGRNYLGPSYRETHQLPGAFLLHGAHYSGSYSSEKLKAEARWIKQQLAGGKDVFAYFNNDAQGYAVENAVELRRYVIGE